MTVTVFWDLTPCSVVWLLYTGVSRWWQGIGQNVDRYLSGYTASHTVKQLYSQLPLWEPQISHLQNYSHGYFSLPYLKTSTPFVFLDTVF